MPNHEIYMRRCLELAQLGQGAVSPNPMVGAVIVLNNRIIGEGWHRQYGGPHAEPNAIQDVLDHYEDAVDLLKQATMYVGLEPCAHHGKTPPCADLLVRYAFKQVVIACQDPTAKVNGKGIAKLKEAGINVVLGVLEKEALFLNRRFFTREKQQRPYVILKWAQTANGYMAAKEPRQNWISGAPARALVHKWRSEEDAILVGAATALIDNPQLNVRLWRGRDPKRIVIDRDLTLPSHLHVFDRKQDTVVFNAEKSDWQEGLHYIALEHFDWYLPQQLLYQLHIMDVQSLLIEGGVKTLTRFIDAGLWDEARIFKGAIYWEDGIAAPQLQAIPYQEEMIGSDLLITYLNQPCTLSY